MKSLSNIRKFGKILMALFKQKYKFIWRQLMKSMMNFVFYDPIFSFFLKTKMKHKQINFVSSKFDWLLQFCDKSSL